MQSGQNSDPDIASPPSTVNQAVGELNHQVIVTNARRVKLITESTRKDDRLDARSVLGE